MSAATVPALVQLSRFIDAASLPMPADVSVAGNVAMITLGSVADLGAWADAPIDVTRAVEGEVIGNRKAPLWLYRFDDLAGYCGWLICEAEPDPVPYVDYLPELPESQKCVHIRPCWDIECRAGGVR